jgi:hypothetical protein
MKNVRFGLLVFSVLFLGPRTSRAFVPYINAGMGAGSVIDGTGEGESLPMDAWADFVGRYGGGWKIEWNEEMGTPRAIYGSSVRVFQGGIPGEGALNAQLLEFVDENRALLGVSSRDLAPFSAGRHGRLWYVEFQQVVNSVPVYGGHIQFRLRKDGRLVGIAGTLYHRPDIGTSASLTAEEAERLAKREASFVDQTDRVVGSRLVVYPDRGQDRIRFYLSWMVELITRSPAAHWFYVVDAHTGDIIKRWNQIYYGNTAPDSIFGRVRAWILPETPTDVPESHPLKDLLVQLKSGGSDVTDSSGYFTIETYGGGTDSILAELLGPFVDVDNDSGPDGAIRMGAVPGGWNSVAWSDGNSVASERNGFYHVILVHDYVKAIDPGFTGLDYQMPCRVNIDQTCNAFWDGFAVNFFRAGGGCANTANIADVIYHEYGHGVTDFQYRPFPQPSSAMHEGLSDYLAATITDQSLIGRGFFGPGTWIRNTENDRVYPAPECQGEPHCVGESIAGSLWDMRQNLVASLGHEAGVALADSLFHYARYGHSTVFPDYFIDLLLVDDDDGDLSDGIPHADEICGGFENHGLSCVLPPNAPMVFDVGSGTDLMVLWQPVPPLMAPITDYHVFYGVESGVYTDSISVSGDTTVLVSGLEEGQDYYFAVSSEDSTGRRSPLSEEGFGTPNSVPLPPSGVGSESHVSDIGLYWSKNLELDVNGYIVSRSVDVDSGFSDLDTLSANDTTYVDSSPDAHVMYYYRVTARDADGMISQPSEVVRGRLMSHDWGILVVDGTKDGSDGNPFSWSDTTVDNFYRDLLSEYPVAAEYDIAESLGVSPFTLDEAIMASYSTVVWHQDDRTGDRMLPYLDDLGLFLSQGGNLLLVGWDLARDLSDINAGRVDFASGSVPHDYLKLNSAEILTGAEQDFAGANAGVSEYPNLAVDSTKAWLFSGNLFNMDVIYGPLVDEPETEPIYTYQSSLGDTAAHDGEIVGLRYLGGDYHLVLFDFPLFYMEQAGAQLAMAAAMGDLGETVGIAGGGEGGTMIPKAFALHQNYPNPFNPSTSIVIDIPPGRGGRDENGVRTRVTIYNVRGERVRVLVDGARAPGRYTLHWDGRDDGGRRASSGLYLYRMEAGDFVSVRKMVLLK